jgi:hypothetical protein
VLSGLGAGLGIEEDATELYASWLQNACSNTCQRRAAACERGRHGPAHVDNRVPRFVALVVEMLTRRESWLPVLPGNVLDPREEALARERLEAARPHVVTAHLAALGANSRRPAARGVAVAARQRACSTRPQDSRSLACTNRGPPGRIAGIHETLAGPRKSSCSRRAGTPRKSFDYKVGILPGPAGKELKTRQGDRGKVGWHRRPHAASRRRTLVAGTALTPREWGVLKALLIVLRLSGGTGTRVRRAQAADYPPSPPPPRQALGRPTSRRTRHWR